MTLRYDENSHSYFIPAQSDAVDKKDELPILTADTKRIAPTDKVNQRMDYFGYYIRKVSENTRNIKYSFSFKPGRKIAKLINVQDTADITAYRSNAYATPFAKVSSNKFAIPAHMPDSGEVQFNRDGQWYHERYTVCEWELTDISPINVPEDDLDKVFDIIFYASEYHLPSVEIDKTRGKAIDEKAIKKSRADKENHLIYVEGGFPISSQIYAVNRDYPILMQKNAINTFVSFRQPHHAPIRKLFEETDPLKWNYIKPPLIEKYEFLNAHEGEAQDIQRSAVKKALGTNDFVIIQGPPGSGKTTVLLETIVQAIKNGARVLLTASTHVAVDNILERLEEKDCFIRYGINPIRIGDEENVSLKVSKYCLNEVAESERKRLLEYYGRVKKEIRTQAQNEMEEILQSNIAIKTLENLIVDSANLVCGTTIGILQAPMIQEMKRDRVSKPHFDIMILDEASKTTFTEFLVPALYCRKFIISGDTKQLTPYTEEKDIEKCISGFFDSPVKKQVCKAIFDQVISIQRNKGNLAYRYGKLIVCDTPQEAKEGEAFLKTQVAWFQKEGIIHDEIRHRVVIDSTISKVEKEYIAQSNILLVTAAAVKAVVPHLPIWYNLNDLGKDVRNDPNIKALLSQREQANLDNIFPSGSEDSWEKAIAWRMCRKFELHQKPENANYKRYVREINYLTPKTPVYTVGNKKKEVNLEELLGKIETVAFSSILELLESGFAKKTEKGRFAIADGLKSIGGGEKIWDDRHVLLKYQWRMHPKIAEFSSAEFYGGNALISDPSMSEMRPFAFNPDARTLWIDTSAAPFSKDMNEFEAMKVLEKVAEFVDWAQSHPKDSGEKWEVAILTFYAGQKGLLVKMFQERVQERFKFTGKYSHYRTNTVNVVIATVDRFQGQEADVVYLSFVRNKTGIGFLDSANRINVAITRAKYQLYMFGSLKTFGSDSEFVPEWMRKLAKTTQGEKTEIVYRGAV